MLLVKILLFLILFLFVLLMLIVLVPFKYQASGDSDQKQVDFKVTWLFRLIGFSGNFKFPDSLNLTFSIFGINIPMDQTALRGKKVVEREKAASLKTEKNDKKTKKRFRASLLDRETFKYIFSNFKKMLKHILPRKFEASGVLGFEDPYYTGIVCSLVEILRGFRLHDLQIQYVFYDEVYEGRFYLQGRIVLIYFAYIAIRLMLNKSVRKLMFNKF